MLRQRICSGRLGPSAAPIDGHKGLSCCNVRCNVPMGSMRCSRLQPLGALRYGPLGRACAVILLYCCPCCPCWDDDPVTHAGSSCCHAGPALAWVCSARPQQTSCDKRGLAAEYR